MSNEPWLPESATDLDVWNVWERPITGTFVLAEVTTLFDLVDLVDDEVEHWRYIDLTAEDVLSLKDRVFDNVVQMRKVVDDLAASRPCRLQTVVDLS